ncbi:PaaI family thioesterase [Chondromyces crocatus]|uniref:Esterase n=1 Tax=Chondromyces crocatus TaxID=52 RepID=A0A0K1EQA3_CHOCO|nr:PaaI family thioesterase [Chondromyces crocatus]AKT42999.1 esterase [Chondromyces crocatus]
MSNQEAQDHAESLNQILDGWGKANGLSIVSASRDEVVAELTIAPKHLQAYGIVHGGMHCAIIETVASIGAAIDAYAHGKNVVGLENHTSFLRAVREGKLRAVARPLTRGRRSQVWEANVYDEKGRVAASGRVRLLVLDPEAELGGKQVELKGAE